MIKRFMRRPKSVREALSIAIHKLGRQYAYLRVALGRLKARDKALFDECELMIRRGDRNRALIYACEVAELRKLIRTVKNAQLAIERVILRLETIREVEAVTRDLRSLLDVTQKVTAELAEVMPDVAYQMSKMNEVVSEVLSETVLSSNPPITTVALQTEEVKAILNDAVSVAEERLKSSIPEPPMALEPEKLVPTKKAEPVLVSATYDGGDVTEQNESYGFDDPLERSFKPEYSPLIEKWVLGYAKKNMGEINVDKCASELNILSKDVLKALESLHLKGKIKIQT